MLPPCHGAVTPSGQDPVEVNWTFSKRLWARMRGCDFSLTDDIGDASYDKRDSQLTAGKEPAALRCSQDVGDCRKGKIVVI